MSVRNALVLFLALFTLSLLVGCSSSSPTPKAPPGGGFSSSSLSGTYVFSSAGENADGAFMTITGSFTASSGSISGGTVDIISADPAFGLSPNLTMSNPSFIISADGRGQINFGAAVPQGATSFTFDFVLTSTSHGLITEFDSNGSGSGTIDLQSSPVPQSALSGLSFSFGVSGEGSSAPFATLGALTLGATGGVTAGTEDFNNGGTPSTSAISTSSFVTVGTGTAPGTAQLLTSFGSGTASYDVYAIDSTHLKFIETDGAFIASGDAYTQGTSIPDGTYVFAMSGADIGDNPLSVAGFMPVSGGTVAGGAEDFNDTGLIDSAPVIFSGGFSALTGGRSQLNVASFVNGAANDVPGNYLFAAYPFSSNGVTGVQLMEIDGGITSGVAYVQSGTTLAASQGYGLNLSAINVSNGAGGFFEEDDIAEFQATSTAFTPGIVDINDVTQGTSYKQSFSGTYANVATGEYTATTTEAGNAFVNFNFYAVNASTFLLLEIDPGQIGTGIFELQNASTSPGAEPGISMVRASSVQAHALRRK
jgi:hypothetical protein